MTAGQEADPRSGFAPVEFSRSWRAFDTYATDLLAETAGVPLAAVGALYRVRAALWVHGAGWSHAAPVARWVAYVGTRDEAELRALLVEISGPGMVLVADLDGALVIVDPGMHRELARKGGQRTRTALYRDRRAGADVTSRVTSRVTSHDDQPPAAAKATAPKAKEPNQLRIVTPVERGAIDAVVAHYQAAYRAANKATPHPGQKERDKIGDRLRDGYSVDDLRAAIDGCFASPFHCGANEKNRKYQRLELIVRDSSHVADFVALARAPGKGIVSTREAADDAAERRFLAKVGLTPLGDHHANGGLAPLLEAPEAPLRGVR